MTVLSWLRDKGFIGNPVGTQRDIHGPVTRLCRRLGHDPNYVYRVDISPTEATVYAYRGKDGFCKGSKFCLEGTSEVAVEEPKTFGVKT